MEEVKTEEIEYGFSVKRERFGYLKVKIPKMRSLDDETKEMGLWSRHHICIECGKEFKSGKALGGHKRIHGLKNLIGPKMILPDNGFDDEFEINHGKIGELVACVLCDKKFTSRKALYGHMRFHPERRWRGILPPSQSLLQSIPSSSSSSLVSLDHDDDDDDDEVISSDFDDDDDDDDDEHSELCDHNMKFEHVLDLKESIGISWNVTGKRGRKSLIRAEDLKPILEEEEEEAMNNCINGLMILANGEEAKLDVAMADNIIIKKKHKRKLSELKENHEQLDDDVSTSTATARDKHVCVTCNKSFTSYQALGGHRASHNKGKLEVQGRVSGQEASGLLEVKATSASSSSNNNNNNGEHICNICHKSFPTGQALGGHKRCHWTGPVISSEAAAIGAASSSPGVQKMKKPEKTLLNFDLNELPPNEEEEEERIRNSPK